MAHTPKLASPSLSPPDGGRIRPMRVFALWTHEPKGENIQPPTSNAQHPLIAQMAGIGCSMLDVGGWMFPGFTGGRNPVRVGAFPARGAQATPRPYTRHILGIDSGVQSHHKAITKPLQSHHRAITEPPQSHPKATLRPPQSHLLTWIFHSPHEMPADRNAGFSRQARFDPQQSAKAGVPTRGYEISGLTRPLQAPGGAETTCFPGDLAAIRIAVFLHAPLLSILNSA